MSSVHAQLLLSNPLQPERGVLSVNVLVEPEAEFLCLPGPVIKHLAIESTSQRRSLMLYGEPHIFPYLGPVQINFAGQSALCGALLRGPVARIGSIAMSALGVMLDPVRRELVLNPQLPRVGSARL